MNDTVSLASYLILLKKKKNYIEWQTGHTLANLTFTELEMRLGTLNLRNFYQIQCTWAELTFGMMDSITNQYMWLKHHQLDSSFREVKRKRNTLDESSKVWPSCRICSAKMNQTNSNVHVPVLQCKQQKHRSNRTKHIHL